MSQFHRSPLVWFSPAGSSGVSAVAIPNSARPAQGGKRVHFVVRFVGNTGFTPLEDVSMKQSCVSAFTRAARYLALTAVVLATGASTLFAQTSTGKIEGKVRDQQGAPIANVQVIIIGSRFGAQTNADGYYFINLVPAGTVTLQAAFIGYKRTQVTDLRVLSGQTITADITMESTPVEVTEITVVAAQNELVPRDAVTTKQNVQGTYTDKLPVDRIANALALQPGVVASTGGGTLSIRGGRTDEQAVYVDGVPV
ncbi:MAG: hypothetical protein E4H41_08105, partial [Gemmatimonadales bacterium]